MDHWLTFLFFVVALFYSSVGFGGGSSYLAILSILLVDFYEIRTIALVLNLVVVSIGTLNFYRNKILEFKAFWPFIAFSMPFSFIGAQLKLAQPTFFIILGGALLLAGIFMLLQFLKRKDLEKELGFLKRLGLGSSVGLLSGVTGIGGGIFLSPTLNLIGWKSPKSVAALASLFILANSFAGLIGLIVAKTFVFNTSNAIPLLVAVVLGGSIGSYLTNSKFNINTIRLLTSILVIYVGARLIIIQGFGVTL